MISAVVIDVVRTASGRGKPGGALSNAHPAELLADMIRGLLSRTDIDPASIDDVIAGCVSQAGEQTLNIARTAVLTAGLPEIVPGTTVDRQCGSSQQAVHFAAQGVMAGVYDVVIAGGVESMSRVPMGYSSVDQQPTRAPLARRYPKGLVGQGVSAELIAARWKITRDDLDSYAARSHQLAAATARSGGFGEEIVGVRVDGHIHDRDQTIREGTTTEELAGLRPAFADAFVAQRFPEINWSITAGNSSPLTDGAAAALIMSEERAHRLNLRPRARLHSFAVTGSDPLLMLTGVIPATKDVLRRAGLSLDDIDAYEVNEAFASVPLSWQRELNADPERLNPRGGAIALGHALGASGVRILATLINHLEDSGGRFGLQTMCEGGGMANAMIVESLR